ncbi:MAG: sigma-70 family RNA polymerase sigma factor [Pseudomonadota bacterium]
MMLVREQQASLDQLIISARSGNPQALNDLLKQARDLASAITSQAGNVRDDVLQNTLIKISAALPDLRADHAFPAWVRRVARNELLQHFRRTNRDRQLMLPLGSAELSENSDNDPLIADHSIDEHIDASEQQHRLRSAVRKLSRSQQSLVQHYYIDGLTYEQVSRQLELPLTAIKSRLYRIRQRLSKEINMAEPESNISLSAEDVASLKQVAASRDHTSERPSLTGIFLDADGYAVASDGHHLVMREIPALKALNDSLCVIPNSLDALNGAATISVHLDEIRISLEHDELAFGFCPKAFPNYRGLLPERYLCEVPVDRAALLGHLDTLSPFLAGSDLPTIALSYHPDAHTLTLETNDSLLSEQSDGASWAPDAHWSVRLALSVSAEGSNQRTRVAVNPALLRTAIEGVDGEPVLKLRSSVEAMEVSGDAHRALVMPIAADFEARTTQFPDC